MEPGADAIEITLITVIISECRTRILLSLTFDHRIVIGKNVPCQKLQFSRQLIQKLSTTTYTEMWLHHLKMHPLLQNKRKKFNFDFYRIALRGKESKPW